MPIHIVQKEAFVTFNDEYMYEGGLKMEINFIGRLN